MHTDCKNGFSEQQAEAPLLDALLAHAHAGRSIWHTPGHLGGRAWPRSFCEHLAHIDLTELPTLDDLNHPSGPAAQAMMLYADACGAGITRFFTTGSTTALYTLLAIAAGTGGQLLVSRTCHSSLIYAAGLLDLTLLPLEQTGYPPPASKPGAPNLTPLPQATEEDVRRAVQKHPNCRAVLLTSPDYYGGCAALQPIAQFLHDQDILLLVDEAHGAHLPFDRSGYLPMHAMAAGADACVQSAHKTLPVLTGGSLLQISRQALDENRLSIDDLSRLVPAFQTSSPSWPIAASLDLARRMMCLEGAEQINRQLAFLRLFKDTLQDPLVCQPLPGDVDFIEQNGLTRDPLRLVLSTRRDEMVFCIPWMASELATRGIDIEFSDLSRLVFIPSLWQEEAEWNRLSLELNRLSSLLLSLADASSCSLKILELEQAWRGMQTWPEPVFSVRDALFGKKDKQYKPIQQASGFVTAQPIVPYPPGIALIWPGERLNQTSVDFILQLLENNISVKGIESDHVLVFT